MLKQLESFELWKLDIIVNRVPPNWMTEASRKFAINMLYYNCQELIKIHKDISK